MPRMRPGYDPELQAIHRIFSILMTLNPEARARVMGYATQRLDTLPGLVTEPNGAASDDDDAAATLFEGGA